MLSLSYGYSALPVHRNWMLQDQFRRYPRPASRTPSRCAAMRSHPCTRLVSGVGLSPTPHHIQLYLNHISHWFHQTCQFLMAKTPQHFRLTQTPRVIKLHQMAKIPPAVINRIRIVNLVRGQDWRVRSVWRATLLEALVGQKSL